MDLTKDQKQAKQQSEMLALKNKQMAVATGAAKEEMVKANRNSKYEIRALEAEGYVHVWTRVKHLDATGKNFIFEDRIIKVHNRQFDQLVKDGAFKTYDDVDVIHDPRANAPKDSKGYNLKPDQINVGGTVQEKVSGKQGKEIDKKIAELNDAIDSNNQREAAIQTAEQELKDKGASLQTAIDTAEREANEKKSAAEAALKSAEDLKAEYEKKLAELSQTKLTEAPKFDDAADASKGKDENAGKPKVKGQ